MPKPSGPYLYLATDGVLSKIGITCNVERRMMTLRSPIKGGPISLVEAWYRPEDYRWLEEYIIAVFPVAYQEEWLDAPCAAIRAKVERAIGIIDRPENRSRFKDGKLLPWVTRRNQHDLCLFHCEAQRQQGRCPAQA